MSTFKLDITCGRCGGEVEFVNGVANGSLSASILGCVSCEAQWEVTTRMTRHAADDALRARAEGKQRARVAARR